MLAVWAPKGAQNVSLDCPQKPPGRMTLTAGSRALLQSLVITANSDQAR